MGAHVRAGISRHPHRGKWPKAGGGTHKLHNLHNFKLHNLFLHHPKSGKLAFFVCPGGGGLHPFPHISWHMAHTCYFRIPAPSGGWAELNFARTEGRYRAGANFRGCLGHRFRECRRPPPGTLFLEPKPTHPHTTPPGEGVDPATDLHPPKNPNTARDPREKNGLPRKRPPPARDLTHPLLKPPRVRGHTGV